MKYYSYCRVSTPTQAERGGGLETQRQEIAAYCDQHGIELTRAFIDAGISGVVNEDDDDDAISKRAALIEMLATIEAGDVIIVANTSRLWRSENAKVIVRRELMRRKAHVRSVEQPNYNLYNKDPSEYLTNAIMEVLDTYDRMNVCLKLARGRTAKALNGDKPCGTPPFGYAYSPDKKHIVIVESEARTVKKMFTLGQTGQSLSKIADAINATGARTRRGKEFSKGTISAILSNRFYIGELTHAGQTIRGNHEPLISRVQFGKVQSQLAKRKRG